MPDLFRPLPPSSRRERWRAALAGIGPARMLTAAATILAVTAAGWWLLRSPAVPVEARLPRATTAVGRPTATAGSTKGGDTTAPSAAAGSGTSGAPPAGAASAEVPAPVSTIVVQVAGKVARPGVYRLPADARVVDLVDAAGGIVADGDPATVALASHLVDGQRVVVATAGSPVPVDAVAAGAPASGPSPTDEPIDLNTATVVDLDRLPGVGPATAAAIVAYRDAHGGFRSVDELGEVRGIGSNRLEALRALVRV